MKTLNNLEFLKTLTPAQIGALGVIRRLGGCSRQEIGNAFNWSPPSVSKVLKPIQDTGLLRTEALARPDRGRRHGRIFLNPDGFCAVGVNVGFSWLSAALINLGGQVLARRPPVLITQLSPEQIVQLMHQECEALSSAHPELTVAGLGVAFAGVTKHPDDLSRNIPNTLPWQHVPLATLLNPPKGFTLAVNNDSVAALLAEMRYGCVVGCRNGLLLYMDEGVSMGIISNGRIHLGHNRESGEFGHIGIIKDGPFCYCGGRGCLESVASAWAMLREIQSLIDRGVYIDVSGLADGRPLSLEDISLAAQKGVTIARNLLSRSGELMGGLLATVINIFDPEKVVLAGKLSDEEHHSHLVRSLRETCSNQIMSLRSAPMVLEESPLSSDASLIGAGALVFEKLLPAYPIQLDQNREVE